VAEDTIHISGETSEDILSNFLFSCAWDYSFTCKYKRKLSSSL